MALNNNVMTKETFFGIANSQNPFFETSFGLTRAFVENGKMWIEYQNEFGFYSQEAVTVNKLNAYL